MKGEVVFYRLFDVGASVDLDEIQKTIDMPFLSGRFPTERAAPVRPIRTAAACLRR